MSCRIAKNVAAFMQNRLIHRRSRNARNSAHISAPRTTHTLTLSDLVLVPGNLSTSRLYHSGGVFFSASNTSSGSGTTTLPPGAGSGPPTIDTEGILRKWQEGVDIEFLTDDQLKLHRIHLEAVQQGRESYMDPVTEFEVFSMLGHLNRGYCCGNACRHCPFQHANVPGKFKELLRFNTAFFC